MPRVAIGQFAVTVGSSSATFIADANNAAETIATALASYDVVYVYGGIYNFSGTLSLPSGKTILGQPDNLPVFKMAAGANKTVITNANATTGGITTNVTLKSLIIDQQGALQTSGGGIVPTGIQEWVIEDVIIRKSYRFNFLALSQSTGVPNNSGTVAFTNGSATVTGSGTLFTTELNVGDIIKSAGNQFGRILAIDSDTSLTLTLPWGYATENNVAYKTIEPNSGCRLTRVRFEGTLAPEDANGGIDASGYGLFDDSTIEYCVALDAGGGGCGFVPDHAKNVQITNCISYNNNNSGFSLETCEDVTITHPVTYGNTENGIQFISGTANCEVINGRSYSNTKDGYVVTYNTTSAGVPTGNVFTNCTGYLNGGYGFRNNGGDNIEFDNVTGYDNNTGGLIINQINSRVPDATYVHDSDFYDDRGASKSQDRGIYIVSSTNALVQNNTALDSLHVIAGIVDTGTNTTLSGNTT